MENILIIKLCMAVGLFIVSLVGALLPLYTYSGLFGGLTMPIIGTLSAGIMFGVAMVRSS
ncbi:hypothetical protein EON65_42845 [archaeon]|nr:MAG: hypothetical protein EON65_42845 [archaeon]